MTSNDEQYASRENAWDQQWPQSAQGESQGVHDEIDNLDEELPFPDVVGTITPLESVRDAEPYSPPTDPPVLPGGQGGIHVATGFGTSAADEIAQTPAPRGDEDIRTNVLRLLREDSLTSTLALDAIVRDGVVYLRGQILSVEDAEHAQWIIGEYVSGVVDVVDETTLSPTGT